MSPHGRGGAEDEFALDVQHEEIVLPSGQRQDQRVGGVGSRVVDAVDGDHVLAAVAVDGRGLEKAGQGLGGGPLRVVVRRGECVGDRAGEVDVHDPGPGHRSHVGEYVLGQQRGVDVEVAMDRRGALEVQGPEGSDAGVPVDGDGGQVEFRLAQSVGGRLA